MRAYHGQRGSLRWISSDQINGRSSLDIARRHRTVDHSGTAEADHIMMVHSFHAATNTLFTIGGNDGGYMVDTKPATAPRGEPRGSQKRDQLEAASGQSLKPGGGGKVAMNTYDLDDQAEARRRSRRGGAERDRHRPDVDLRLRRSPLRQHQRRTGSTRSKTA